MHKKLGNLVLIIMSIAVALMMAEGVLRLFPGLMSEGAAVRLHWRTEGRGDPVAPHDYIGIVPLPEGRELGENSTDATAKAIWGHRNLPPWPEQAGIVVVGDSFAYSQTVALQHAWTTLLDRAVPETRVITLGTVGTGPEQYYRVFETYGTALKPELVIVGLFPGNDVNDAQVFDRWQREAPDVEYGRFVETGSGSELVYWLSLLSGRSYLLALTHDLLSSISDGRLRQGETITLESGENVQIVPQFLKNTAANLARPDSGLSSTIDSLSRTNELANSLGAKCLVVLFPSKEEVYGQFLGDDLPLLSEIIVPELERQNIDYFDLGPVFIETARDQRALFHEVDGHPNELGYQLIADTISRHLARDDGEVRTAAYGKTGRD